MKRLLNRVFLGAALIMAIGPCLFAEEEGGERRGRSERMKRMRPRRGGDEEGEGRRGKMKERLIENLPGAEEEIARHKAAMKAIREKGKETLKSIRQKMMDASPEERQTIQDNLKTEITAIATEGVEERILHQENMLNLQKANKSVAIEKAVERIMNIGKARREERQNDGNRGSRRGRPGGRDGGGEKAPEEPQQTTKMNDDDIAAALAKALE